MKPSESVLRQRNPAAAFELASVEDSNIFGDLDALMEKRKSPAPFSIWSLLFPSVFIRLAWKSARRVTFVSICLIAIVWLSTFLYISLYYLYVPSVLHHRSINFQFDAHCLENCNQPYANVSLSDYRTASLFARGQQYSFTVELEMPESDVNWSQGMFMVRLELYDLSKKLVLSSARSAILGFKSYLMRLIHILTYWPLIVTGFKSEQQLLSVTVLDDFVDGSIPNAGFAVSASILLEARQIQVYSSTLKIQANLQGLRYFMVNWPLLSAALGIFSFICFLSMIAICSVYRIIASSDDEEENEAEAMPPLVVRESELFEKLEQPDSTLTD